MSSSVYTVAPNIDKNLMFRDIHLQSGENCSVRAWSSTNYSNSVISFSCPPPSMSVFIDRMVLLELPITVTYAGTTGGSALLQDGYDALRAYPIASVSTSVQCTINNQQFSLQTSDVVPYLAHYFKPDRKSTWPIFLDKYAVYSDGVTANNNPLASYKTNSAGYESACPRGGFPMTITNGATSSTIATTVYEPIWVPPFHSSPQEGLGFTNVRTMDFVINLSSQLNRIVSHATSLATLSGVTVALGQPVLRMFYTSPPIGMNPTDVVYGGQEINRFPTQTNSSLAPNASTTIISTNMQLNAIPTHIYAFVRPSNAELTYTMADFLCQISNVNITFNNQTGILSSSNVSDLFNMSKSNGLQDDFEEFNGLVSVMGTVMGTSGSVVKLAFGKDISLSSDAFPGKIGAFNLQINVYA